MSIADRPSLDRSVHVIGFAGADLLAIEHNVEKAGARLLRATGDGDAAPFVDLLVVDAMDAAALDIAMTRADDARHLVIRTSLQTVDAVVELWPDAETVVGGDPVDLPEGLGGNGGSVADRSMSYRSAPPNDVGADTGAITAAEIRAIIRLRRLRDRYFPGELFADPAWDMLLDLAAARVERTRVAVSSLCIAAAVPPTTALRWIKAMTDKDLLRRVADPHDARRIFIQLSNDAAIAMDKYLRAARGAAGQPI